MPRDIELVKQELESSTTSIFITKWILEHTPYVFEDYETEYISWRHEIAEKLRIDARDIIITGSASLGFNIIQIKILRVSTKNRILILV